MSATIPTPAPFVHPILANDGTGRVSAPWKMFFDSIFTNLSVLDAAIPPDNGDTSQTLIPMVYPSQEVWNTPLTANRTVSFTTSQNLYNGATFTIIRTAAATGAYTLTINASVSVVLTPGFSCTVTYNGSQWLPTIAAPLSPSQLANGTYISSGGIYTGNITAGQISTGIFNANVVYAGQVVASQVVTGTLNSNITYAGNLSALSANLGVVYSGAIYASLFSTGANANSTSQRVVLDNVSSVLNAYDNNNYNNIQLNPGATLITAITPANGTSSALFAETGVNATAIAASIYSGSTSYEALTVGYSGGPTSSMMLYCNGLISSHAGYSANGAVGWTGTGVPGANTTWNGGLRTSV